MIYNIMVMAKNLNFKKLMRVADSKKRVNDMRSGGSGSLRSSLFNRQDEALTQDVIDVFTENFKKTDPFKIGGGNLKDTNGKKRVCGCTLTLPDKVNIGNNVDALLAKVDYDKNTRTFKAYYRPKNGKWGMAKNVENEF